MEQVRTPADLGAMARAARMVCGWTQQQAADAAGVSRRFVNMVEGGHHSNAELWRVLALMNALGAPLCTAIPPSATTTSRREPEVDQRRTSADNFDLDAHLDAFRDEAE